MEFIYRLKVISLCHVTWRTISFGRIKPAVRDAFKFPSGTCRADSLSYPHLPWLVCQGKMQGGSQYRVKGFLGFSYHPWQMNRADCQKTQMVWQTEQPLYLRDIWPKGRREPLLERVGGFLKGVYGDDSYDLPLQDRFYHINGDRFEKQYKEILSGYHEWPELSHAEHRLLYSLKTWVKASALTRQPRATANCTPLSPTVHHVEARGLSSPS